MRTLFLLFFGFLIYRFLIRPLMLGFNDTNRNRAHSNANRMDEMLRRMQEMQQQQYSQPTQQAPKKSPNKKADDGEYIDYEEVD
jgi:hypothetical protein